MTITTIRNIGALVALRRLSAAATATAAGTGDSTTTTGATIDRFGFGAGRPNSMVFGVAYDATLATSKTLSIGYAVQDSDDGVTFADFATATYATVATGTTAASVAAGTFEANIDLSGAKRYVRGNFAVDLSATQTDTAAARAVGVFGGFDKLPA